MIASAGVKSEDHPNIHTGLDFFHQFVGSLLIFLQNSEQQKENAMNLKKVLTILVHAFIGWALCAATIGIGMATMSMESALVVHAIGAPIFFTTISLVYFTKFNYTTPLQTALIFVSFVIVVDFFVVALMINRSLESVS